MKRLAGVVVVFHPPSNLQANILTYLQDLDILYVFDNSPGLEAELITGIRGNARVVYLTEGKNKGVPAALNIAAHHAAERGCEFLLTMDQDSAARPGMVRTLSGVLERDPAIGLVSPSYAGPGFPESTSPVDAEPVLTAMTSGSLIRLTAHRQIGGFLEKLFVDCVDHEYCLRLQEHGFKVVRSNRAVLLHTLGRITPRMFFGRQVYVTNHSPGRYYFQTRNRRYVRDLYRRRFPQFLRYDSELQRGRLVKMILFERQRISKCVMVIRGFLAGWKNDFSANPEEIIGG